MILQVKNSSGEDTREGVEVSSADEVELAGSRGTAHFALKWARDARQQANLNVVEDIKGLALQYSGEADICLEAHVSHISQRPRRHLSSARMHGSRRAYYG